MDLKQCRLWNKRTSSRVRKIRCNAHSSTYVCANKRYDLKIKHFLRILILRRCERGVFVEILQRQLLFKLAVCQGIGNLGILKVLQEAIAQKRVDFSSTEIIRIAEIKKYRELFEQSWLHHTIHSEALYIRQCQHQFMTILDAVYPKLLREIYNPPAIFYRGNLQLLSRRKIGIVGARYATSYGLRVTEALVPKIVKEGFTIVSGLAKGIDSRSHEMAIQNGVRQLEF